MMTVDKDVTKKMGFQNPDDEHLPITRCMCGKEFNAWDFIIDIYRDSESECSECGRSFYFRQEIHIYRVGKKTPSKTVPIEKRFWEKVDIQNDDDCWKWLGNKSPKGYGEFYSKLRNGKHTRAHQISWMLFNKVDDVPEGMCVCHTCDNPSCVNPYHLWLGTYQENVDDKMKKGRWRSTFLYGKDHPQHGENSSHSKLTENDVREIRDLRSKGYKLREIAEKFGVTHGVINNILQGRKWAWLK